MTLNHQEIELIDSFEQIAVDIYPTAKDGSRAVAQEIAALIKERQAANKQVVLGLATGSTPKYLYAELVRLHKEEGLSFKNVLTFNLDEYYPIEPDALQSYNRFMKEQLFNHIDIPAGNYFVPDGTLPKEKVKEYTAEYERRIEAAGGIDLQILGIGTNGHIGFNEPGSTLTSHTRLVTLDHNTRQANAFEFSNISQVPRLAITMGLSTIFKAKRIVLLAWGTHKAKIVRRSVEGHSSDQVPASLLQQHPDCKFVIDEQAAEELTRYKEPWLTGDCEWTPKLRRKAVTNLALKLNKPILMLTDRDYNENGLNDLIVQYGSAYELNIEEFNGIRDTITGWPGGKPGTQLPSHPERSQPEKKRVLLFSPHPDDDIISMGGTFIRLHEQGHDVHVAYQTSGNIAVTDEFLLRYIDFAVGFEGMFDIDRSKSSQILEDAKAFLRVKKPSQKDTPENRAIKGLIRRGEAKATCRYVGIPESNIHYQNLPFYETGTIEKKPMGEEDIQMTVDLIREVKPHQIYCAGDLADPHGTHKVCLEIIFAALDRLKHEDFMKDCWVWMYKGAWQEWNIHEIEMAVPMSPDQVLQKRLGIFIHQSQKDVVPFQGSDLREFWERAEDRNANTANLYDQLGLQKYAAMEAFARYHFM
ncbi:glucosamine-6-phosphate deaminase [Chitinophaga sp. YR627]|uniref:Glucosamine-6-phosphate deaminase n=2 Tax=Chitinophaga pinensis TaxID=79329 RepID=A0A979GAT9_CHIPD|nr:MULTISPECIES: glucosamine-6-phosphate deaminase [Chitinophaga]ACU63974.1 glucosamine-6-phosphate isomerase [Chitinophaga pinensis DSM 2588]TWW01422.1 glucosamine-6-phosphate deaminase [Chitinophaga pinensis]SFP08862.1 glucosamine-6-phosphate deaminase [Chitinophaga sp. YR627]